MTAVTRVFWVLSLSFLLLGFGPVRRSAVVSPMETTGGGDNCGSATQILSLPYNDTSDTSTATDSGIFLSTTCTGGGAGSREGPDLIYSIVVSSGNSLTFQVTPSANYDVDIYLLGTCGTGSSCVQEKDTGIEGQTETLGPVTLQPGTYFFYVDSVFPGDDKAGSGTYSLSVTGSLGGLGNDFYTVSPCRVLDTREPNGPHGGPAISSGVVRTFAIVNKCNIPPGAKSVSINATVTLPTGPGYLTLFPGGAPLPLASTINFSPGQTRANNAIAPLSANGTLSVFSGQPPGNTVHFILDVNGYFQ
jgi:hypothetical protein